MTPLMTLQDIAAVYDTKEVLHDISLTIYERDFLGIIGPNGGGKTTLVKILLGLMSPVSGTVTCYRDGNPVAGVRMGYLPQYSRIDHRFPISVYDTVCSGLASQAGLAVRLSREQHERVGNVIHEVGLEGVERCAIGSLSGGQLQRALLARAVVSDPELLILDEPDTYLDRRSESQLYRLLADMNKRCAIVLVSHDIGTVLQNVRSIACVDTTIDYHPSTDSISASWIEEHLGCPIELLGHGHFPHRVLARHHDEVPLEPFPKQH
ncbi:MAG: ABC transporter ATP-binding protein [Bacteroidaceae bacterium]|nr:ABC transporter ATP-binding protein [Bacteroidaceae bacterium]